MKKITGKLVACLLTAALLFSMAIPFSVSAATGFEGRELSYFEGDEGHAFDGTAAYSDSDNAGIGNGAENISISLDVKFSAVPTGKYAIAEFYQDDKNYIVMYVDASGTNPRIGADIVVNGTNVWPTLMYTRGDADAFTDNDWHPLSYTFEGNTHTMTLDSGTGTGTDAKGAFNGSRGLNFTKINLGGADGGDYQKLSGAMRNVKIKNNDAVPAEIIAAYSNGDTMDAADIEQAKSASSGAVAASYKLKGTDKQTIATIAGNTLEIDPSTGTITYGGETVGTAPENRRGDTTQWHSVFLVFSGEKITSYFDGTKSGETNYTGFISGDGDSVVGEYTANVTLYQSDVTDENITEYAGLTGSSIIADVYADAIKNNGYYYDFSRQSIMMLDDEKSSNYRIPALVQAGDVTIAAIDERKGGSQDYADIDLQVRRSLDNGKTWGEQVTVSDFGKPENVSLSGWQPMHIDPCLAYDSENDVVYLVMDMFPESAAAMGMGQIMTGSGFFDATLEDGTVVRMQALNTIKNAGTDQVTTSNLYQTPSPDNVQYGLVQDTSLENGDSDGSAKVYEPVTDTDGNIIYYKESKTYFVPDYSYGQLVKDTTNSGNFENAADAGNIFVYTTDNKGELTVTCTMYIWLYKSYDKGETWTNPINISGFKTSKQDWMRFCGTAPGAGIIIEGGAHDGRIVFPCYYTNATQVGVGPQSSAALYSDDGGKTWTIGHGVNEIRLDPNDKTAIQTYSSGHQTTENSIVQVSEDGKLRVYCRNTGGGGARVATAVSTDGGETWHAPDGSADAAASVLPDSCFESITEVYCQLAAINYHDPITGKYYVVISNPLGNNGSGRKNMGIHVRELNYETGEYAEGSQWITTQIGDADEAYSALTQLKDGSIGLFWEMTRVTQAYDMPFQRFTIDYLTDSETFYPNETMSVTGKVVQGESGSKYAVDAGDEIIITVSTHDPVYILGDAKLKLNIGGTVSGRVLGRNITGGTEKYAKYLSGSGTTEISFSYTVTKEDNGVIAAWEEIESAGESNSPGDVDLDGSVTSMDATCILQHIAEITELTGESLKNAETDGVEGIASGDATAVLQHVAEIITEFVVPAEEGGTVENTFGSSFSTVSPRYAIVTNTGYDPTSNIKDIPYSEVTVAAGSSQSGQGPEMANDNNDETLWHDNWKETDRNNLWFSLTFSSARQVDGLRYLTRASGTNGIITKYAIDVLENGEWKQVAEGEWTTSIGWKIASFDAVTTTSVRLRAIDSLSDTAEYVFASAREIRVTQPVE